MNEYDDFGPLSRRAMRGLVKIDIARMEAQMEAARESLRAEGRREILREIAAMPVSQSAPGMMPCWWCGAGPTEHTLLIDHRVSCLWLRAHQETAR